MDTVKDKNGSPINSGCSVTSEKYGDGKVRGVACGLVQIELKIPYKDGRGREQPMIIIPSETVTLITPQLAL